MAGSGEHIKALVRTHASGDDSAFYAVALQVAAQAARQGHHNLARDLKDVVDASKGGSPKRSITPLAQPRNELAELVTASYPDVGLRDLVGPDSLLRQVRQVLAEQRQRSKLAEYGFAPMHRLLLEGPPGTGKTMTASVLAHELSVPLFTIRLDALLSKFLGETSSKLRLLFDAVAQQRAVYLFDEFDALGANRASNDVGEARRILNTFLVFLEEASSESIVIAATNNRSILDRALFRRFDSVLVYHLPDREQARAVMSARLGTLAKGVRWPNVAAASDGLAHADLVKASEAAAKGALMAGKSRVVADDIVNALDCRRMASLE